MSSLKSGLAGVLLAVSTAAAAQTLQPQSISPEPAGQPLMFGNLQLFPSLSLRDVGVDSNIYNASQGGRDDFTYTVRPGVKAELPIGDARVVGTAGAGFVFFRTAKDQESLNSAANGLFEVRNGRVRPSLQAGFTRGRQRQGDIDDRALSVSANGRAGLDITVSGITSLTMWVSRDVTEYDASAQFLGRNLSAQLDRKTNVFAAGAKLDVTPLTSIVAAAELEQVRFKVSRSRDADSWKLTPTARFAEGAIINGQAFVGLRDFRPIDGTMRPYRGLVAGGDIRFTVAQVTRFDLRGNRDLVYSYDELQPYYLDSGGTVIVSQRVVGPVDAIGMAGRRRFRYQAVTGATVAERIETMTLWGGGVGVRVDENVRLSFTIDRERRISTASTQRFFERTRALAALEYQP